jgi:DTW domain-containing protein
MDVQQYRLLKEEWARSLPAYRQRCPQCRKAEKTCYCHLVSPFESKPRFVILIHRGEARNSVATGRMAHLCLTNSLLIEGADFSENEIVNQIVNDPSLYPAVLYPSRTAVNLSNLSQKDRSQLVPNNRELVLFVIDGTWSTARSMRRLSTNLKQLPEFCFTPTRPSTFKVRKQPHAGCLSTIEAIHQILGILTPDNSHDHLLNVFDFLVRTQVAYRSLSEGPALRGEREKGAPFTT